MNTVRLPRPSSAARAWYCSCSSPSPTSVNPTSGNTFTIDVSALEQDVDSLFAASAVPRPPWRSSSYARASRRCPLRLSTGWPAFRGHRRRSTLLRRSRHRRPSCREHRPEGIRDGRRPASLLRGTAEAAKGNRHPAPGADVDREGVSRGGIDARRRRRGAGAVPGSRRRARPGRPNSVHRRVSNAAPYIAAADAVVLASRWEGLPIVALSLSRSSGRSSQPR